MARLFFEHWVCVYGAPAKIISDRDVRFVSKFWASLCKCIDARLPSGFIDGLPPVDRRTY